MSGDAENRTTACSQCAMVVEVCAFCDRPECPFKVCYRCLRVDLRQSMDHPHLHGG